MCDFIQITPESLFKQGSSQLPTTPLSEGTNSTTLSQKSQSDNFENKNQDSPLTSSSTQTLQQISSYDKDAQTHSMQDKIINNFDQNNQENTPDQSQRSHKYSSKQLLQQYLPLDKLSLIQMLIEEKKKNQNLLNAYTRDTKKLKNELFDLKSELNQKNEVQNSTNRKHTQSACQAIFLSSNSEQSGFQSSCINSQFQSIQKSINQFTHTFSNLQQINIQQNDNNKFNSINLIQNYTPNTPQPNNNNPDCQKSQISNFSSKIPSNKNINKQQDISSPTLKQKSPKQKLIISNDSNTQQISQTLNNDAVYKSTAEFGLKSIQTIKLLNFLEDLVIKCSPNNLFKENEKPNEKQIWKFIKTMTEEYVTLKRQEIQNCKIISTLKEIFKASSIEKVIQLAKLQSEEVQILRKKIYFQENQVTLL